MAFVFFLASIRLVYDIKFGAGHVAAFRGGDRLNRRRLFLYTSQKQDVQSKLAHTPLQNRRNGLLQGECLEETFPDVWICN